MYKFALTVKDEMIFKTAEVFSHTQNADAPVADVKEVKASEIEELQEYFSMEEAEAIKKEQEYLLHGPGKIERILNDEMSRLQVDLEEKIQKQDEEFLTKMGVKKWLQRFDFNKASIFKIESKFEKIH